MMTCGVVVVGVNYLQTSVLAEQIVIENNLEKKDLSVSILK